MACTAGDRQARAVDLGDVVGIDLVGHGVHDARVFLHRLGIIRKLETRTPVRANAIKIFSVAGIATNTERICPLFHDVVHLLAGEVLGEHLQVGGRGKRAGRRRQFFRTTLGSLWSLSRRTCQEEARCQECNSEGRPRC